MQPLPAVVTWKSLIAIGLSFKVVVAGAAYAIWATSARSGAYRRAEFLEHVREVMKCAEDSRYMWQEPHKEHIEKSVAILTDAQQVGIRTMEEWTAFWTVIKFLTDTHARSTAAAVTDLSGRVYTHSLDWLNAITDTPKRPDEKK